MAQIVVLAGGTSRERAVSLRSGQAIAAALRQAGHNVKLVDPAPGLAATKPLLKSADAVFPALHGSGGEDGQLQSLLSRWHITFVGSNAASSRLCFNKWAYRRRLLKAGIKMATGALVNKANIWQSPLSNQPFVLKPVDGGSSIDTYIIRNLSSLNRKSINAALKRHHTMLLERLISGQEITVGVLGQRALPVVEIVPPPNSEFDYKNKYNGATQEICPPRHIPEAAQRRARALALDIHRLTGCRDFSRTDIIVAPGGAIYALETNTIPGLTTQSLFPKAAAAAGLSFPWVADRLVAMALARNR